MKVLSVALLLFAAGFIQTAAGITCSFCAPCWKIGSPGVDVKMSCAGPLGDTLPMGTVVGEWIFR